MAAKYLTNEEIATSITNGHPPLVVQEVAEIMKVTPDTVRIWMNAGKMRAAKDANGMWRTIPSEIARYVMNGPFEDVETAGANSH